MAPQSPRKLTLIDAMILVAAAALGFAGVRAEVTPHLHPLHLYSQRPNGFGPGSSPSRSGPISISVSVFRSSLSVGKVRWSFGNVSWFSMAQGWADSASLGAPGLAALSLAMLAIRLRRPRPPWPHLIREAGFVASLVTTIALAVRSFFDLLILLLASLTVQGQIISTNLGPELSRSSWIACRATQPSLIGLVVLTSWLALALGGHRRRDRSLIDRAGIATGSGWIVLFLVDWFKSLAS